MEDRALTATPATRLLTRLGGRRGLVEGAVPPLVFAATNAVAGFAGHAERAAMYAVAAALASAILLLVVGAVQRVSLAGSLRGAALLGVAVGFVLVTGSARSFFLPGIGMDLLYAISIGVTVLLRRPAVGYAYAFLFGLDKAWRRDRGTRRAFALASLVWSGTYALRAGLQLWLYIEDQPAILAIAKVALGWPLTALAVLATLAIVRRTPSDRRRVP